MEQFKLGKMEEQFADLIWEAAPVATGELTRLCEEKFGWKRTTTYTMLKRLCDRELFANEGGTVVVKISREDFRGARGEQFIQDAFDGSLPSFLTAFSRRHRLGAKEIDQLKKIIEEYEEE